MIAALACLGLALPAAAAQADDVWTGASTGSSQWSDSSNWSSGAPASPAGTLTFPDLGSCEAPAACYTSNNDLTGISMDGLVFSNNSGQYRIGNHGMTVGAEGIRDASGHNGDVITAPISLSSEQTWIVGSTISGYDSLTLLGGIAGSGQAVTVSTPRGDLFIDSDMEVGPVTSSGPGTLHIGAAPGAGHPGSINGSDGASLTIGGGALIPNPGSTSGPLRMNAGTTLLLGTNPNNNGATTLQVRGAATLSSSTSTTMFINGNGTSPGTDFSQLSASGTVALGGTLVLKQGGQGQSDGPCQTLQPGDVATLVSTTGDLTGTFSNAPEGTILTMASSCQSTLPKLQIHYTANTVIATVVASGTSIPTTTTLATPIPSPASTNQAVTLTANVSTSSVTPSGTVAFSAGGHALVGCDAQPVTGTGSSATATCTTSFAAAGSPESLTAAFNPASGSGQAASTSAAQSLTVNPAGTSTTLAATDGNAAAGGRLTYTAMVTPGPAGATEPGGTVAFLDGGSAISSCSAQPLESGASSSTATCTVSYVSGGRHAITATYGGDRNFNGSSSSATVVTVGGAGTPLTGQGGRTSPASAITLRATDVGTSQAVLNGRVSGGGVAVTWRFEYGRTTAYGHATVSHRVAAGDRAPSRVSQALKSLSPNVRYHFRLVISAAGRRFDGKDMAFTTKAQGRLTGPTGRLTVVRRSVAAVERCRSTIMCRGRITLTRTTRAGNQATIPALRCAAATVHIKAGQAATIHLTMSAACLRLLQSEPHHRLPVSLAVSARTGQLGERKWIMLVLQAPPPPAPPRSG